MKQKIHVYKKKSYKICSKNMKKKNNHAKSEVYFRSDCTNSGFYQQKFIIAKYIKPIRFFVIQVESPEWRGIGLIQWTNWNYVGIKLGFPTVFQKIYTIYTGMTRYKFNYRYCGLQNAENYIHRFNGIKRIPLETLIDTKQNI